MDLIVDTNILISFFRNNPVNAIISSSSSLNLKLFIPEQVREELLRKQADVLKYAKINLEEFNRKFSELEQLLDIIPKDSFKEFELPAKTISPHEKDIPLFALALKLKCPIWSNEPAFKNQSKVNVFSTRDMVELIL
jgi:predicted nucleic acid-binding protein